MYKYLLLLLISFWIITPSLAQEEKKDTTDTEDNWDDWDKCDKKNQNWEDNLEINVFDIKGAPTISMNYGLTKLSYKDFKGSLAEPRGIELKLGYTEIDEVFQSSHILKTNFKKLFVSNINNDLNKDGTGTADYTSNSWRFGAGKTNGYGYKVGPSALFLTSGTTADWTKLKFYNIKDTSDLKRADYLTDGIRFGTAFEAGIRLQIIKEISIEANYERAAVFPRHMFWKWLGSAVIENAAQFMVDEFVDEILDTSPYFAPVMSFLLKNGLSYGLYELRKEKMNWPFKTAAPLMNDQFKFGITFVL